MEKGINLSLTKSLAKLDALLDKATEAVPSKKLSVAHKVHKSQTNPINFEDIFDEIFSKKMPMAHEGAADGSLSQDEIDALLSGGDSPAVGELGDVILSSDDMDELLSQKKVETKHELNDDNVRNFRIGKYVKIDSENKPTVFWIGYGWEENEKSESRLWLEFDAKTCPSKYWENLYKLVGTTGKYYSEIDFEFVQVYMNAWLRFNLREEYLKQFYDENVDIDSQREILTGFINEVVEKL